MIKNLLFFVVFLFTCERSECIKIGRKGVSIKVVNESGRRIEKMILIAPGHRHHRNINKVVESKDQLCLTYESASESSYQLLFIMENGDTIQTQENYAEGGYSVTETIKKNHVTSSNNNHY